MNVFRKITAICCIAALGSAFMPFGAFAASGSVCINEICAKNTAFAAPDGGYYDWVELYNGGSADVNLSGYGLSDKAENPFKYTFPDGAVIRAGQRIIVYCDSKAAPMDGQYLAPMGLSTSGETLVLTAPDGNVVDSLSFDQLETNMTYSRVPDGSESFAIANMTPNEPNKADSVVSVAVQKPVLSQEAGFYDSDFSLNISAPEGTEVYYTLDGSQPTAASTKFTSPITVSDLSSQPNDLSAITDIKPSSWMGGGATAPKDPVDKAFIINAVAVDKDGNVSDTVTATYFIGYQGKSSFYKNMKVISLVTDRDNLFDYEKGIYVMGKVYDDWKSSPEYSQMAQEWEIPANYTQKGAVWERQASMQIFDNGQLEHTQNIGIRIHGGATRAQPQKSFNVYARSEYGASKLKFDLFSGELRSEATGKKIKEFDSFMLRNAGNDCQYARFRDKLNQELVSDREMLTQGMEPCIVFINGEFWGHYEITEKLDEDFVNAHYKVGSKNVCIVKNQELDAGDEEDYDEWKSLREWVKSTDMSSAANYAQLCEKIDMRSFADYITAELYYDNKDWGDNNTAMWKSTAIDPENPYADGKWRFILFDTEYSLNLYGQTPPETNAFTQLAQKKCFITELLTAALKNPDFKRMFCTVYMDMANENFSTEKVNALISAFSTEYNDFAVATLDRFYPSSGTGGGGWGGIGNWGGGGGFGGIGGWGPGGGNTGEEPAAPAEPGGGQTDSGASQKTFTNEVNSITSFYSKRFNTARDTLKSYCQLGNAAGITVKNDSSRGNVTINTITPDFAGGSWSGTYFSDYPVVLTADGEDFSYWELSDGTKISAQTAEIELKNDVTVTAVYGAGTVAQPVEGDINTDGKAGVADLVLMHKHLLGSEKLTSAQMKRADLNGDGRVDTFDLVKLRKICK